MTGPAAFRDTLTKALVALATLAFVLNLAFILIQPNRAMNEDLGRHIKLGEIIWKTGALPDVNLFSYTHPLYPFLNHHWLSEVVFYLIAANFGLLSITALKIILIGSAVGIAYFAALRLGGITPALIAGLLFLPFIAERNTERPEMFGFLFFSLFLFLFFSKRVAEKWKLAIIPPVLLLWVNLHASFLYGIGLLVLYVLTRLFDSAAPRKIILLTLAFSILAVSFNPHGVAGALYPLRIYEDIGYLVTENADLFLLANRLRDPVIPYFMYLIPFLAFLLLAAMIKERKIHLLYVIFFGFAILTFLKIRAMPYFLLSGIPALSLALYAVGKRILEAAPARHIALIAVIIAHVSLGFRIFSIIPPAFAYEESAKRGVDFFLSEKLPGNIFNNFDIGGYLDYRLYPGYKVFVDNRPEAFPLSFFKLYIAAQTNPRVRKNLFAAYRINSVIFSRTDITDWARAFLNDFPQDPDWRTAYIDDFLVIFTRKHPIYPTRS